MTETIWENGDAGKITKGYDHTGVGALGYVVRHGTATGCPRRAAPRAAQDLLPPVPRVSNRAPVPEAGTAPVPTSLLLVPPLRAPVCGVGSMDAWRRDLS